MDNKKLEELRFPKEFVKIVTFKGPCSKKKLEELGFLKEFLEITGLKAICSRVIVNERPDSELTIGEKTIGVVGVELTTYQVGAKPKEGSKFRAADEFDKQLMERVNEKVRENINLQGITGTLYFNNLVRPKKKEVKIFVDDLIKFVIESISGKKDFKYVDLKPTDNYPLLKKYLLSIYLYKSLLFWDVSKGKNVDLDEEDLINLINPKIAEAPKYKKENIDELWLLVVFGILPSQAIPPPKFAIDKLKGFKNLDSLLKESLFNKVHFYLRRGEDSVVLEWPTWKEFRKV